MAFLRQFEASCKATVTGRTNASPSGTDMDNYLVIMTVDNDVDYAVYVRASDCECAFVEAAKLFPGSQAQPRVAQLVGEAP